MCISVARSAVYAHHELRVIEMNRNSIGWIRESILFGCRFYLTEAIEEKHNIPRPVEELMEPPVCFYQGIHGGAAQKSGSFLSIYKSNIIVAAIIRQLS